MTTSHREQLEQEFHKAMLDIYSQAKRQVRYTATRFRRMVNERGGLDAAQALLATHEVSDGFTELWLRGKRLDLSVEYLVLKKPWRQLFSDDELAVARKRLCERDCEPPPDDAI